MCQRLSLNQKYRRNFFSTVVESIVIKNIHLMTVKKQI